MTSSEVDAERTSRHFRGRPAWISVFFIAILFVFIASGSAQTSRPNGAGLVIQHGDGTLIYMYVPFEEESISGEELLASSALALEVDVFGGLGMAVCSLNGEGCPSDDCFCHSYSDPANFWHYYTWTNEGWLENPLGVSTRILVDGDIDGWSWNAGAHSLPLVTIDEIASINGFDRSPPEPTATPAPTEVPTATALIPTATSQPIQSPSPAETATATSIPTETTTVTAPVSTAIPTPTLTLSPQKEKPPTVTLEPTSTLEPTATSTAIATNEPAPQAAAVIITPGATPQPLPVSVSPESSSRSTFVLFAAVFGVVVMAGLILIYRNRQQSTP